MNKYYYRKNNKVSVKKVVKISSLGLFLIGLLIISYAFLPLLSWSFYFAPAFAEQEVTIPIPKTAVVKTPGDLMAGALDALTKDYTNANVWFPNAPHKKQNKNVSSYTLSIPKINIDQAIVSNQDNDLASHLVHFEGTTLPPQKGNAVIFGHSTLPQLFNPKDYKTIFANAYKLTIGDKITATVSGILYTYKIMSITVVDPSDTSIFYQDQDTSYLTLVTCTPPGTTWKRLIIKAQIQKL